MSRRLSQHPSPREIQADAEGCPWCLPCPFTKCHHRGFDFCLLPPKQQIPGVTPEPGFQRWKSQILPEKHSQGFALSSFSSPAKPRWDLPLLARSTNACARLRRQIQPGFAIPGISFPATSGALPAPSRRRTANELRDGNVLLPFNGMLKRKPHPYLPAAVIPSPAAHSRFPGSCREGSARRSLAVTFPLHPGSRHIPDQSRVSREQTGGSRCLQQPEPSSPRRGCQRDADKSLAQLVISVRGAGWSSRSCRLQRGILKARLPLGMVRTPGSPGAGKPQEFLARLSLQCQWR